MHEICTYHIEVKGKMVESNLAAMNRHPVTVIRLNSETSQIEIITDQSGLVGLIRHLHSRGIELLSISRDVQVPPQGVKNG